MGPRGEVVRVGESRLDRQVPGLEDPTGLWRDPERLQGLRLTCPDPVAGALVLNRRAVQDLGALPQVVLAVGHAGARHGISSSFPFRYLSDTAIRTLRRR